MKISQRNKDLGCSDPAPQRCEINVCAHNVSILACALFVSQTARPCPGPNCLAAPCLHRHFKHATLAGLTGPQDMTTLVYLNEPSVLNNLRARYVVDDIYTYTGSILIAVNPFARLPHLYGTHMMEQYRGVNLGDLSPHVYAIADAAYQQMRRFSKSQSILVRIFMCCLPPAWRLNSRSLRSLWRILDPLRHAICIWLDPQLVKTYDPHLLRMKRGMIAYGPVVKVMRWR